MNCIDKIASFNSTSTIKYNKTIFRLPLRTKESGLSDKIKTIEDMRNLVEVLKSEAKVLLLFLRSVSTIQVYDVDKHGRQTLSFQVTVADSSISELRRERSSFIEAMESYYLSDSYYFSSILTSTLSFDVTVYDHHTRQSETSSWLVVNQVGSSDRAVCSASAKLKVFPWVGAALERDQPGSGRIFCFLPLPVEATSNLPVHINGAFGVSDDRRSLKWPGAERKNDDMANWNYMLVKKVLPQCYAKLLLKILKVSDSAKFYKAWPSVSSLNYSQWKHLLVPLFSILMVENIICSKVANSPCEKWVTPTQPSFIPRNKAIDFVVKKSLMNCQVKLAEVPTVIWEALDVMHVPISEVSPQLVRHKLRNNPRSYSSCSASDKKLLLKYCLSDENYSNMTGLTLLPVADGNFVTFHGRTSSPVYLCTEECPSWLLLTIQRKLVDVENEDSDLYQTLIAVANKRQTQLRVLTVSDVASLLDEVLTALNLNSKLLFQWLAKFWYWVRNKDLSSFSSKSILPVLETHATPVSERFQVLQLSSPLPILYFYKYSNPNSSLLSALDKLRVKYCLEASFPFASHPNLSSFIKLYSPENLLNVLVSNSAVNLDVTFTIEEAKQMMIVLSSIQGGILYKHLSSIKSLKVFMSCINSNYELCSLTQVQNASLLQEVVLEPPETFDLRVLPANVVVLSSSSQQQNEVLSELQYTSNNIDFLINHIFPNFLKLRKQIDSIMTQVLDLYYSLAYRDINSRIMSSIKDLQFVRVKDGTRKKPSDLYDPRNSLVTSIFEGECVFPCSPYDNYLDILKSCGLKTSIQPQTLLNLIYSLSLPKSSVPQLVGGDKLSRMKAVIEYISAPSFHAEGQYTLSRLVRGVVSFNRAIEYLSVNRCWLPVLSKRSSNYPSQLPWLGEHFKCHMISLSKSACMAASEASPAPLLYGSQAFFAVRVANLRENEPVDCLIPHFVEVMKHANKMNPEKTLEIVKKIYSAIWNNDVLQSQLRTLEKIVYIKAENRFVSASSVFLKHRPKFRTSLKPYLHVLPDSISAYKQLFLKCGMMEVLSESQILSVLNVLRCEIDSQLCSVNAELAWSLVLSILNWVTNNGTSIVNASIVDSVYAPKDSNKEMPSLRDPRDMVYTDNEFLKHLSNSSDTFKPFVHERISPSLAKCLHVTPLSEELDISEDTFEDAGQHEPLVERLKNILKEYKDGVTIVKELIQNADDASASVVKICFDTRRHDIDTKTLPFPGMKDAHGPALVMYNDSQFSDEDFVNIQKLAGATKQEKHLKIGKFGIGFCSVYHITDVPSFISRDRLYIFDPMLRYLKDAVSNTSKPGKKINFLNKAIQKSCQMQPYEGLFGFARNKNFNATLFRLPFRSHPSELSSTCYSESSTRALLAEIKTACDQLVLFLQNVHTISVLRIDSGMSEPSLLFEVRKTKSNFCEVVHVAINSHDYTNMKKSSNHYLVAAHGSTCRSKPAVANVACQVERNSDGTCTVNESLVGGTFCYLPLSQPTGLPVHVSCNFAVISNRRGIWTYSDKDASHSIEEVKWNIFLMESVIPEAYKKLLVSLKLLHQKKVLKEYKFYCLWPLHTNLQQKNPWELCINSFYSFLQNTELFYSQLSCTWLKKSKSKFLDPCILGQQSSLECIQDVLQSLKTPVVELPEVYKSNLKLGHECLTEIKFIEIFFSSLNKFDSIVSSRNLVILSLLAYWGSILDKSSSSVYKWLSRMFSVYPSIPASPEGQLLRKCTELVDPNSYFAALFRDSDQRFPIALISKQRLAMVALREAGIMHESLSWDLLIEQALKIQALFNTDKSKALERSHLILSILKQKFKEPNPSKKQSMKNIPFLPTLPKPANYPLPWLGEKCQVLPGNQLIQYDNFNSSHHYLERICGSQIAFLNEELPKSGGCGYMDYKTVKFLGLNAYPSLHQVISHFKLIIERSEELDPGWIKQACSDIYHFFDESLTHNQSLDLKELKELPVVWNGKKFLPLDCFSQEWRWEEGPYLFRVPAILSSNTELTRYLDVKQKFKLSDACRALKEMKNKLNSRPVDEMDIHLIKDLVNLMEDSDIEELKCYSIYLPDQDNILCVSTELSYNDVDWMPLEEDCKQVHSSLSKEVALRLGVKPTRSRIVEQFLIDDMFMRFGQHEDLTTRIQGIIRDYDFDITILKELLQNADDAKSSKVCFILDFREHKANSILSDKWKDLQGPALLIWNDSVFSEKDYEGIQSLGMGSKRESESTIGQYGIGFNAVYHLTDCPSFISGGESLCIFDPHCKYTPRASSRHPGAKLNVNAKFWEKFADLKSAFLQDSTEQSFKDFQGGTLFRFPLRHTAEMVRESKIIDSEPLTPTDMSSKMQTWMPIVKESIFFLNHIREVKYVEISKVGMVTKFCCRVTVDQQYENAVSKMLGKSEESFYSPYQITLTDESTSGDGSSECKTKDQKWLIQKGLADTSNRSFYWETFKAMKPRHAIAVPLDPLEKWTGKTFCFLPLPSLPSHMPAHINGSFFLDSHRRALWKSSNPKAKDDRSRWNDNMFHAIASSYAHLLVTAREKYLKPTYKNWHLALQDVHKYYSIFPSVPFGDLKSASTSAEVLKMLISMNADVLCVLSSSKSSPGSVVVEWHPIITSQEAKQVHVWNHVIGSDRKIIHPILETLGMKISSAPTKLVNDLNRIIKNEVIVDSSPEESSVCTVPLLSPATTFKYYTQHSKCAAGNDMKECQIEKTVFQTTQNFVIFLKYLLAIKLDHSRDKNAASEEEEDSSAAHKSVKRLAADCGSKLTKDFVEKEVDFRRFPGSPFSHFLLLTADGVLRKFIENQKVLNSKYYELFPMKKAMFLHPELQAIPFDKSYFISLYEEITSDDEKISSDSNNVVMVFKENLPRELHEHRTVSRACDDIIAKHRLKELWECLNEDTVISSYCSKVLSHCCLLLTTDNRLFSLHNDLLPSYKPELPEREHIFDIMKALQMPIVDTSVVPHNTRLCLPSLHDHDKMLRNFHVINQKNPLAAVFKSNTLCYDILIDYFSEKAKPGDEEWRRQIVSLPFFIDVVGTHVAIAGKTAYICSPRSCMAGYQDWVGNSVFIKETGSWTKLGSSSQLEIKQITAVEVYLKFIFPNFSQLSEDDRYEHLKFIRNSLYDMCRNESQSSFRSWMSKEDQCSIQNAKTFMEALKQLKCVPSVSGILLPVSSYFDHEVELFHVFNDDFPKLPSEMQNKEWRDFCKGLGLQTMPSPGTFLKLCEKVSYSADNNHEFSSVLLQYVFSDDAVKEWSGDIWFLNQVSNIAFVPAANTASLSAIAPSKAEENDHVCINNSAPVDVKTYLWTVKSIIRLPYTTDQMRHDKQRIKMLQNLNIVFPPTSEDIIRNITSICSNSRYTNEELFDTYPETLIPPVQNLLRVMIANFKALLKDEYCHKSIEGLPCIPVYCDPENKIKMAMVKPTTVISHMDDTSAKHFYPYLHLLPTDLQVTMPLLTAIGVKPNLEIHHMQLLLEKIYYKQEGSLDPNAKLVVKMALLFLSNHLPTKANDMLLWQQLHPLYLPDTEDQLQLSTSMIYSDTLSYCNDKSFDFTGTSYSYFDISKQVYNISASDLCRHLPSEVCPKKMSSVCRQIVDEECDTVEGTPLEDSVNVALHHDSNTTAIVHFHSQILKQNPGARLESLVRDFTDSIKVVIKRNLKTKIVERRSNRVLGCRKSDFYFESRENSHTLYIDAGIDEFFYLEDAYTEVADSLCEILCDTSKSYSIEVKKLADNIKKYLKADPAIKKQLCQRFELDFSGVSSTPFFGFELGLVIPDTLHFRLDQNLDNMFRPFEYVGFEDINTNQMFIAQIVYLEKADESNDPTKSMYRIRTKNDSELTEIVVSSIHLYKINSAATASKTERDGESLPNSGDEMSDLKTSEEDKDISEIKDGLRKKLQEIWGWDANSRNTALRRLYLQWHPDKNLHNVKRAEEMFMFLKDEIGRLEGVHGRAIVSHEDEDTVLQSECAIPRTVINGWDHMASSHRSASQQSRDVPCFPQQYAVFPEPEEGKQWIKQAEVDFDVLCCIHDSLSNDTFCGHVCFMAHQVAEKALKGGAYFLCGLENDVLHGHHLTKLARILETVHQANTDNLVCSAMSLESYYLDTRYPNRWPGHTAPSGHYYKEQADEAKEKARRVLDIVKNITS